MQCSIFRKTLLLGVFTVLLLAETSAAHAATLFRSYLSATGNDSNPCTLSLPCRLLPAALAVAQPNGEVWMLDSANYNVDTVTVSNSVTILAIPGAIGSIVTNVGNQTAANSLSIPNDGVQVTLRNISFVNLGGALNLGAQAVNLTGGDSRLVIENSQFGNGLGIGVLVETVNAQVVIHDSSFNEAGISIATVGGGQSTVSAVVDHCHIVGLLSSEATGTAISVFDAQLLVSHSVISHSFYGILADFNSQTFLDDDVLSGNTYAINMSNGAVVSSGGNNAIQFNGTDVQGGTLVQAGLQ